MWRAKGVLAILALLTTPVIAQVARPSVSLKDVARDQAQFQGPSGIIDDHVDAWVRGDTLYFRGAQLPQTAPYQEVHLAGPATQIAASEHSVYVWVRDFELYGFSHDDGVLDPSPIALPVDYPAARIALEKHATNRQASLRPAAAKQDPDVLISPQKLFVTNAGGGIANNISGDSLDVINTSTNAIANLINLNGGDAPNEVVVAYDNSVGYIANFGCATCIFTGIAVFNPTNSSVQPARWQPANYPYCLALSSDATRLYAGDNGTVRVFDQTGKALTTQNIGVFIVRLALTSDNKFLIALQSGGTTDQITVVNTSNMQTVGPVYSLPSSSVCNGLAIAPGDKQVFVGCYNSPKIYSFSLNAGVLTQTQSISTHPTFALSVSPDGKKLYAPHTDTASVDILDTTTLSRITQIQTQTTPANIILNAAGTRAYTANVGNNTVAALDLTNNAYIAAIPVGPLPYGLALTAAPAQVTAAPQQLNFKGNAGQANPTAQNIALSIDQSTPSYTWTATATTQSGGSWLTLATGTATPGTSATGAFPATLAVSVTLGTLAAGTYNGTISIATPNTGNTPQSISVTLVVSASGTLAVDKPQVTFAANVGAAAPTPVTLNVTNSGAGGSINWTAVVTQGNAPWLSLTPASGTTPGTLVVGVNPQGQVAGQLSATISVTSPGALNTVTIPVTFTLSVGPVVPTGGIVNAASFAANTPVAAGSLVSIFGSNFGPSSAVASTAVPLPTILSGVQVIMGGFPAPLVFVSGGQINCQVPFEVAGQTTTSVIVMNGTIASAATTLSLAPSAPGIFTATIKGQPVGAILKADFSQITSDNPVKIGDVIQIFATGQGAVTNAPATGAGAPTSPPLALTPVSPTVTIGGQPSIVAFSGLSPGFVGLWQVNVTVPSGVTAGNAVPVQITLGGVTSNSGNISVVSP